MRPRALVFVDPPQYSLEFLPSTFENREYEKLLIADSEMLKRNCYRQEQLIHYKEIFPTPIENRSELLRTHSLIAGSYQVKGVVGFSEVSVLPTAILAEKFGVPGIGSEVARNCRNKLRMMEQIWPGSVRCARQSVAERAEDLPRIVHKLGGYPVICKPLMGFASFGVIRSDDEQALKMAFNRIKRSTRLLMGRYYGLDDSCKTSQVLVQSYIPGKEIAVDGYVSEGRSHILGIIDKPGVSQGPYFADSVYITPARLDASDVAVVEQNVQASVTAIGLDNSPFHIEARIKDGQFYLLELAARVAFVRGLRNSKGIDSIEVMIAQRLGEKPAVLPKWHRYGGTYHVTPAEAGIFEGLKNRELLLQDPRVQDIPVYARPGQRVAPAPESTGDIAHVIVSGDTYDEVLGVLNRARDTISVIVK